MYIPGVCKYWAQILCVLTLSKTIPLVLCIFFIFLIFADHHSLWQPVSLMYLSSLCVDSLGIHTESLCLFVEKCSTSVALEQWIIILQRNEIIKKTSWSVRQRTLSAIRCPLFLKAFDFFSSMSRTQHNLHIWWMLLILDGSSSKDAGFPRIPCDAPTKTSKSKWVTKNRVCIFSL